MRKETLVVIPARGGSQGIPRKNLAPLAGLPLIAHTIRAALGASAVTRVLVSTDDAEIAEAARAHGAETPFLRPAEISGGAVHAVAAPLHALEWLRTHEGYTPERIVMLLPTSPLRRAEDVQGAIELFEKSSAPAVISVVEMDKQLPHLRRVRADGVLEPLVPLATANVQRQDLEPLFALNGSIYVSTPSALISGGTFHLPAAIAFPMLPRFSVDINSPADLMLAEFYLSQPSIF
jgi:CMP-N-acetylneuraminic acid synthetase